MNNNPALSVIIPAYNEADNLKNNLPKIIKATLNLEPSSEFIVAIDGSSDNTSEVMDQLVKEHGSIILLLPSPHRLGKGKAIAQAIGSSKGDFIVFMDPDLAVDLTCLKPLIETVRNGYDICIGSRLLKDSQINRSYSRELSSVFFNMLVRLFLSSEIKDHQCGFKAFKADKIRRVLHEINNTHFCWDTELLIRAQQQGFTIAEIPVIWTEPKETKVSLLRDSLPMLKGIISLYLE